MKRLALLAAVLALPLALAAQNVTSPTASVTQPANGPADVAGQLYAANFAHWTIKPSELGLSWTSPSQCYGTSGGINFKLFSTSAPITIVDVGVPANTETVTPSIASYNGAGCSVGLPATHAHSNYYLQSGTLGLQEALNWIGSGYGIVVVTPDWVAMGGTSGMITAATGSAAVSIEDARSPCLVAYLWSGSAYVPQPNSCGGTGTVAIGQGGTGATTAGGALTNLGAAGIGQANTWGAFAQNFAASIVTLPTTYTVGAFTITQPGATGTLALASAGVAGQPTGYTGTSTLGPAAGIGSCPGVTIGGTDTVNYTALQACLNAGKPVYLPYSCAGGEIAISAQLVITFTGQILRGTSGNNAGLGTACMTALSFTSTTDNGILLKGASSVDIENLTIQCANAGAGSGSCAAGTVGIGLADVSGNYSGAFSGNFDVLANDTIYGFAQAVVASGYGNVYIQNGFFYSGYNNPGVPTMQIGGSGANSWRIDAHINCSPMSSTTSTASSAISTDTGHLGDLITLGDTNNCPVSLTGYGVIATVGDNENSNAVFQNPIGAPNHIMYMGSVSNGNLTEPYMEMMGGGSLIVDGTVPNQGGTPSTTATVMSAPTVNPSGGILGTATRYYNAQCNNPSGAFPQSNEVTCTPSSGSTNECILSGSNVYGCQWITINESASAGTEQVLLGTVTVQGATSGTWTWTDTGALTASGAPPAATAYMPFGSKINAADDFRFNGDVPLGTSKVSGNMIDTVVDQNNEPVSLLTDHHVIVSANPGCTFATRGTPFYVSPTITSAKRDGVGFCYRNAAGSFVFYDVLAGAASLSSVLNDTTNNIITATQSGVGSSGWIMNLAATNASNSLSGTVQLQNYKSSGMILEMDGVAGAHSFQFASTYANFYEPTIFEQLNTATGSNNYGSNILTLNSSVWNGSAAITPTYAIKTTAGSGSNPYTSLHFLYSAATSTGQAFADFASITGGVEVTGIVHLGTIFTISSGCTTSATSGGATGGSFTASSSTCSPVISTGVTAPNGYACTVTDMTTAAATIRETAYSATTVTFTGANLGGTDQFVFSCDEF